MKNKPEAKDLGVIAATLLNNRNVSGAAEAAQLAHEIWDACDAEIETRSRREERRTQLRLEHAEAVKDIPMPKKFPATLAECLRVLLPKNLQESDRDNRYRAYMKASGSGDWPAIPSAKSFDESEYQVFAKLFLTWRDTRISELRAASGHKGGSASAKKRATKRKKVTRQRL